MSNPNETPQPRIETAARQKCRTKLIPDRPVIPGDPGDRDAWEEENPHQRVALALADLLRTESGGIAVGVEGSWGAGKTTVMNLLRHELALNGQLAKPRSTSSNGDQPSADKSQPGERLFAVVTFDAWAHEKDPLRRTFLENLVPRLAELGWVNSGDWTRQLEIIGQKREVKHTDTFPQLRVWGALVGLSFFLIPIGTSLLNASSKDVQFTFQGSTDVAWKFVFGLMLVLGPVLILLTLYVAGLLFRRNSQQKRDDQSQDNRLWAMLFSRIVTSERTETFKTPNPTSVEFADEFKALLDEALEGKVRRQDHKKRRDGVEINNSRLQNRHLVLVLDNLDRVDAQDALSIWSTLQTFLGGGYLDRPSWAERLWNVVLYDPVGIRALWDKGEPSRLHDQRNPMGLEIQTHKEQTESTLIADAKESQPDAVGGDDGRRKAARYHEDPIEDSHLMNDRNRTSSSFLDKSFRIRFEVPPPVLSDWRKYLIKFLTAALPDHSPGEFVDVYSVLAIHYALAGELPTIRNLKIFVNQIGAVHRQWAASTSPEKSGESMAPSTNRFTPNCIFDLKDIAYFVLLRRSGRDLVEGLRAGIIPEAEYKDSLSDNATEALAAIAFNVELGKARQVLLETPIERALLTSDTVQLSNLAEAHGEAFWDVLHSVIRPRWLAGDSNRILSAVTGLNGSDLLSREKPPLSRRVIKSLRVAAMNIPVWPLFDDKKAAALAALWTWNFDLSVHTSQRFSETLLNSIALGVEQSMPQGHVAKAQLDKWFDGLNLVLETIHQKSPDSVNIAKTVIKPIADRILAKPENTGQKITATGFAASLGALFKLRKINWDYTESALAEIAVHGAILDQLYLAIEASDYAAGAWCFFVFWKYSPDANNLAALKMSGEGEKYLLSQLEKNNSPLIAPFTDLIATHRQKDVLFTILDRAYQAAPFVGACLDTLVRSDEGLRFFTGPFVLERWTFLSSRDGLTESSQKRLIESLINERDPAHDEHLLNKVMAGPYEPHLSSLYGIIVKVTSGAQRDQIQQWCLSALEKISVQQWVQELKQNGDSFRLFLTLTADNHIATTSNYIEAIVQYAGLLIKGEAGLSLVQSPFEPLSVGARQTVRERVRNLALEAAGKIYESFFTLFGSELYDAEFLLAHGAENAGRLFLPLLRESNVEGLEWVLKNLKADPSFCKRFSETELGKAFINELSKRLDENLTTNGHVIEEILELLTSQEPSH